MRSGGSHSTLLNNIISKSSIKKNTQGNMTFAQRKDIDMSEGTFEKNSPSQKKKKCHLVFEK